MEVERRVSDTELVYSRLRDEIVSYRLEVGVYLPPEAALAARHGVSLYSVRMAIARLVREGLLETRRPAGTSVRDLVTCCSFELVPDVVRSADFETGKAWLVHLLELRQSLALRTAGQHVVRGMATPAICRQVLFNLKAAGRVAQARIVLELEEWLIAFFIGPPENLPLKVIAHQLRRALGAFHAGCAWDELLEPEPRRFQTLFDAVDAGAGGQVAELVRSAVGHRDELYRSLAARVLQKPGAGGETSQP